MQELGANPNPAKVHVEGAVVSRQDEREKAQGHVENEHPEDPGAWTGRLVQQLSAVWGYAMIGSAANMSLVASLSSLQWTDWGGEGADAAAASPPSSSTSQGQAQGVPEYNMWALGILLSVVFPTFVSLRTTFAVAQSSPRPFPAERWMGWKYAPHCLISMLGSTLIATGLTYVLPVSLGARVHYYFGEAISFLLQ